jgi:Ca2+-binding RTX toxin-like protein
LGTDADDTITGSAGSDKLTGGKGADIFTFSATDFWTVDADGNPVAYNKAVDTITDFNPAEGDTFDFGEDVGFYSTPAAAQAAEANLFYSAGKIYLDTNIADGKFTYTPIVTVSSNPLVLSDNSGFASPLGTDADDTITGSAGSDKLTGGKGADIFTFSATDFWTVDADGNPVAYNKAVDTITDFNPAEGDTFAFGDLGEVGFYSSAAAAQTDLANLYYSAGNIYLNTNTAEGKFTYTPIIKLTGTTPSSFLNSTGDGWADSTV